MTRVAAGDRARGAGVGDVAEIGGVRITHPGRVLYAEQGLTKLDLARYYASVAQRMIPLLSRRPLTLVRCPSGRQKYCFFQKHTDESFPGSVRRVRIEEKDGGTESYAYVTSLAGVVALVNVGTLELHGWGSRADRLERPDRVVFDLDPDPGVAWADVCGAAFRVRARLQELGLRSFAKTTGGKGLHVVAPVARTLEWDRLAAFARAVAKGLEAEAPERFTTEVSKAKRKERIFLDYLRNTRGATAVEAYSSRAREGAPVATPVRWEEVGPSLRPNQYTVSNFAARLAALGGADPWAGYGETRQFISAATLRALRVE